MDPYGIEVGLKASFNLLCQLSRQTNRDSDLIRQLCAGDLVVCLDSKEAVSIERDWLNSLSDPTDWRGTVEFIEVSYRNPEKLLERMQKYGAVHFTHRWVEAYFQEMIWNAGARFKELRAAVEIRLPHDRAEFKSRQGGFIERRFQNDAFKF